jgi:hypothetical protein
MVNKQQKGYRNETLIRKMYKDNGYETFRPTNTKWGDQDIFHLWDLLVFNGETAKLIQVKSNPTDVSKFKMESYNWLKQYCRDKSLQPTFSFDYELFLVQPKSKGGLRKWDWNPYIYQWEEWDMNKELNF